MIALIVSDSKHETALLETYAKQAGYDCVTYGWLLKALDNLEEISPHVVIINAVDYPRHWKILAMHTNVLRTKTILLVSPERFNEEEQRKACHLGITGLVRGFSADETNAFLNLLKHDRDDSFAFTKDKDLAKLLFLHPKTGTICTGCITAESGTQLVMLPDNENPLCTGDFIEDAALKDSDGIRSVQAEVTCVASTVMLAIK